MLSTKPYKGTRDFYPEDKGLQNYIFDTMRLTAELFGYEEYDASILEETEVYRAKSSEEIVNEQTYSFTDRGGRDVTLRPEMTPTVARMIAARRNELAFPLRWYSIPNVFRYERPQRGRLREHWQLNVDLFGVDDVSADIEIIQVAAELMQHFGATADMYTIKINSRIFTDYFFKTTLGFDDTVKQSVMHLIDRMHKIEPQEFEKALAELMPSATQHQLQAFLKVTTFDELAAELQALPVVQDLRMVFAELEKQGIANIAFDPTLMRGFDYYTGIVFEVFDTHPENNRSLFGGGRYDGLVGLFGAEQVSAVGFGAGDVTLRDFLEVHRLLPDYEPATMLHICVLDTDSLSYARQVAHTLRHAGVSVALNTMQKKIAQHIKTAEKQHVPFLLCIGESEVASGTLQLKKLTTHETFSTTVEACADTIFENLT